MENLKKVADLVGEFGNVLIKVIKALEAKQGIKALTHLSALLDELFGLMSVEFSLVDDEFKASRAENHTTLKAYLAAKFNVDDDDLEEFIEQIAFVLTNLDSSLSKLIDLGKKIATPREERGLLG